MTEGRAVSPAAIRLVDLTLDLIERMGGLRQVNLREVARLAKCSHANLYNYFSSFEDLLWATLDRAIERLVAHTETAMQRHARPEGMFHVFVASQIDFALSQPGAYRLIWLETLSGNLPPAVALRIRRTPTLFAETLRKTMAPSAHPATVERAARIIHGYLHGEICKLVCARTIDPPDPNGSSGADLDHARNTINTDVQLLAKLLLPGKHA
jgi:AcrR family transcriptional regulator